MTTNEADTSDFMRALNFGKDPVTSARIWRTYQGELCFFTI